jgi:hypothetical protein
VKITGSSNIDFIEGTVDPTSVVVTGTGDFERMRELEMTITADGSAVEGTNVVLMNADKKIIGIGIIDINGVVFGVNFRIILINFVGIILDNFDGDI